MTELVTSGSVGGMASNGRLYPEDGHQGAFRAVSSKARRGGIVELFQRAATKLGAARGVHWWP
jgi:hypothetical protein